MSGFTVLVLLFACLSLAVAAPLLHVDSEYVVSNQYIVVFHENSTVQIRDHHVTLLSNRLLEGEKILNIFNIGSFIGFSAVFTEDTLQRQLDQPAVSYIEADQHVSLYDTTITQTGATWGLDRIDQRNRPVDGLYQYWASAGAGVTAYIIDTGILTTHNDFGTRATFGYNYFPLEGDTDLNGHGTHVAGIVGGTTYGVAKQVQLVAIKVFSVTGSGTTAGIISGVNWAAANHQSRGTGALSVASMSLGGPASDSLDSAVINLVAAGVVVAVAAGNDNTNACNYSPARVNVAITVGATTDTDIRASYSNYGPCVGIFAPGDSIQSDWIGSNTATNTISGTSVATPHVAGAAAVYLGHLAAPALPADVISYLISASTPGVITYPGTGSPNKLLYSPYQ